MEKKVGGVRSLWIFNMAMVIAKDIYLIVKEWDHFDKNTLGTQIVRAADSVANNIAEGYARPTTADKLNFFIYSESSLQEVRTQLGCAAERNIISIQQFQKLEAACTKLSISIIEYCNTMLNNDPTYTGKHRQYIARRRSWRAKK